MVVRDTIDNDWGSIVVKGSHRTLGGFVRANSLGDVRSMMIEGFRGTREEAFTEAKSVIDRLLE